MKERLLLVDASVQSLMLIFIGIGLAGGLASPGFIVFALLTTLPLGAWQLISALLKSMLLDSRAHAAYMMSAIIYLFLLVSLLKLSGIVSLGSVLSCYKEAWPVLGLPAIAGAIWYTRFSWSDYRKAAVEQRSEFV